jgi:thiamine-monophosphate kinase
VSSTAAQELFASMLARAGDATLAEIGEKSLLADFLLPLCRSVCGDHGLGDDAGVLSVYGDNDIVITTDRAPSDLLARQFGLMSPTEFGSYLVRVNVSDLAAEGASPLAMVVASSFKPSELLTYVIEVMWGIYVESEQLGCPVVGGDTKASAEESLAATALGIVPPGMRVGRGPVRPGMRVFLSGPVGHAGVALRWFMRNNENRRSAPQTSAAGSLDHDLREYLVQPKPRIDLAKALCTSGCPCAMDITDGFGQSLREIATMNQVDIELDYDQVTFYPAVSRAAGILGLDMRAVLGGIGLDLELLAIGDTASRPQGFHDVGRVTAGRGNVGFSDGGVMPIKGFEHFSRTPREFL